MTPTQRRSTGACVRAHMHTCTHNICAPHGVSSEGTHRCIHSSKWDKPLGCAVGRHKSSSCRPLHSADGGAHLPWRPWPSLLPCLPPTLSPSPNPPCPCLPACLPPHSHGLLNHPRPFPADRLAAGYAYILTHPGIPCIFCDHIFAAGSELQSKIKALSEAREGVCCAHMHAATCLITTSAISAGAPRACWNPAALPVCLLAVAAAAAAAAV